MNPADGAHSGALERVIGRVFAAGAMLLVAQFWFSAAAQGGQRPGSVAADILISVLLAWAAARVLGWPRSQPARSRRELSQRDLCLLAVATGVLAAVARALAVPGSPFLAQAAYTIAVPAAGAWAVWSRRLVAVVPVLLVVLATGAWRLSGGLPAEQLATALATVAFAGVTVRALRSGARRADADAARLARRLASQDAALAAAAGQRRAATIVHDDVLSVLRALAAAGQPLPWSVLVSRARQAQAALARQPAPGGPGPADLGSALRCLAAGMAPELDVRCCLDDGLGVPEGVAEALRGAVAEALRNVAAHAGVHAATVSARGDGRGCVEVTVRDSGAGFDPARVGPASTGLRASVRARLGDVGGRSEIISSPGRGTTVVLVWQPADLPELGAVDALAWVRRLTPPAWQVFTGLMLPFLLASLVLLGLRWQDMRWQPVAAAAFAGLAVLAAVCARSVSRGRMTGVLAASLTAAVTALAVAGVLAIAPGTTDPFANWVAGDTGIVVAAVYFVCGPAFGLIALAADLAALFAGLLVTGRGFPAGSWVEMLGSPALGAGVAIAFRAMFRRLSEDTEAQLAGCRDRLRRQARAEAMSRADDAALQNARRIAAPVLDLAGSGRPPDPALRMAAALAGATLRDELLAPGFLTAGLAGRARAARIAGCRITVEIPQQSAPSLLAAARRLLNAALTPAAAAAEVTLQIHAEAGGHPALLVLHVRDRVSDHAALRERARECGAQVSDLADREFLIRLQEHPEAAAGTARRAPTAPAAPQVAGAAP